MSRQSTIPDQAALDRAFGWAVRPVPTAEDIAAATAFIDGEFSIGRDPAHHARHRSDNIRRAAMLEMGKRQDTEIRERIAQSASHDPACLAAVEALPSLRAPLAA